MDSFTQIVLGGAIGNAIAGDKLKNRAVLYGAIIGTVPDLDILFSFVTDPITAVELHRSFTHSVFTAVFAAFVFGYIIYRYEKKNNLTYEDSFWLVFWGLFTHACLDVFTTWGTELLWPFKYDFAFKSIFVIDPLYTIPFAYCLYRSMKEKVNLKLRNRWNRRGLYISSTYLLLTLVLKGFAFFNINANLFEQDIKYKKLTVRPSIMNTVLWNATVETEDEFLIGEYSFFDKSPMTFLRFPKNEYLMQGMKKHELIERLIDVSENQYTLSIKDNNVYFNDLRYGLLSRDTDDIQFAFSYKFGVDEKGELKVEEVKKKREDGFKLLKRVWYRLQGI